ncbi:D-alanine--D-alanine ligase [Bradymonadaceae bacterium TMQ3]|uniref:D-alanine--D-alanine ligase n=1 Tax=Lujinxingia sediminis TaxID=2480984 RepID=A0ABY0CXK1_9DELT|nr:D-alanine--D-alanine ligase [Lujinxingia sediminis]RDV39339.1 D-alanine--D-alanine ligase [Bradymonadaceae bacterium TMQ3]RVU48623.1 D-alanine--D-alanine ligase [Lujinxingia sediminis]TXC77916.1 D-alanine--D-alanine ligase [Bradymonadales bacterium TMQ1]
MFSELDTTTFRGKRVGVVTGGDSPEREISLKTGAAFENALRARGYDVTVYDLASDVARLVADIPAAVIIGSHGGLGENGSLQGLLECAGIPYTGSGVLASALAMDKARAREAVADVGVPVARGLALRLSDVAMNDAQAIVERIQGAGLKLPIVVKLNDAGSSFGVAICQSTEDVHAAISELRVHLSDDPASALLLEDYIEGPEYTVGFFGDTCLGAIQITAAQAFYDYEAKYKSQQTRYDALDEGTLHARLEELGRLAYQALGCRGVARVDFKGDVTSSQGRFLEVNTIPGMTATSLVPKMAAARGVSFEDFVELMLSGARLDRVR